MNDDKFPSVPDVEAAYRAAHAALAPLVECVHPLPEPEGHDITELLSHLPFVFQQLEQVVAARVGPRISWQAPHRDGWDLVTICVDLDESAYDYGGRLADIECGPWNHDDIALARASKAYRRECGWDHAPGSAGVWLLKLAPVSSCGSTDDDRWYSGFLTAFLILHDRDGDGHYESVAHMWTALDWRRRGIGSDLLEEARTRFAFDNVEGPLTDAGRAVIQAAAMPAADA